MEHDRGVADLFPSAIAAGQTADGRYVVLYPQIYNVAIVIGRGAAVYDDRW